jgi:predicted SPOUT superfamily RNA methylase MTH1
MQVALKKNPITILLPDSLLGNEDTLLLKTRKIGTIARTVTMFRIDKVCFYKDSGLENDRQILNEIFYYLSQPPYLRKYSPRSSNLRYTAILPPLHSPNHGGIHFKNESYKSGILVDTSNTTSAVDTGENSLLHLPSSPNHKKGQNVIIKTTEGKVESVKTLPSNFFWKTEFIVGNLALEEELQMYPHSYKIAASKSGIKVTTRIMSQLKKSESYVVAFGPIKGSFK